MHYLADSPSTVLLSKDNHELFHPYMSQTEYILTRKIEGEVSLPAGAIWIDLSFFLKSFLQTKHFRMFVFLSGSKNYVYKSILLFEIY